MSEELVSSVEGPKGKADIYEIAKQVSGGGQQVEYEIRFQGTVQVCKALGEAYITAGELSGTPT